MAKANTAVVVKQSTELAQVETFITEAIKANASVETMSQFFDLRVKVKAEVAKEQFTVALGAFQNDCPVIKKTKSVNGKDGKLRYQFAPLDGIVSQIKPHLAKHRLSYSWDVQNVTGHMKVTCKITHFLGHFETSTFEIPIDSEGFMTAPQKYASAQTFAKRYTLINALGVSTGDDDTDATDVGKEPAPKSDKSKILFLLRKLKQKVDTKESVTAAVKKLAQLDLVEKNFAEIVTRLEAIVFENENN